jgi:hypothetical protein
MYSHGEVTPGSFEVDANSCASDPEMPDWGDAPQAPDDMFVAQQARIKQHIKHEAAVRRLVRNMLREVLQGS